MNLTELLKQEESEFIDFKREYHSNNAKLLHDILCLINSLHSGDRYLIFGVQDDKTIVGIEKDLNRKKNSNIQDLLRQSNFNRFPTMVLKKEIFNSHEIDILVIKDRYDKPFYLTKDKKEKGFLIRNGVIYTRLGDTNIPVNECSPEANIEQMWKERFGLNLTPLEKVTRLLNDINNWSKVEGDDYLYHNLYPEFLIRDGKTVNECFSESWTRTFPDPSASSFEVNICYHNTILIRSIFVHCDGGRYRIPLPVKNSNGYTILRDSIEWKIAQIYRQYFPLDESLMNSQGIHLL